MVGYIELRCLGQPANRPPACNWAVEVHTERGLIVRTVRPMRYEQALKYAQYLQDIGSVQAAAIRLTRHNIYQICNE